MDEGTINAIARRIYIAHMEELMFHDFSGSYVLWEKLRPDIQKRYIRLVKNWNKE